MTSLDCVSNGINTWSAALPQRVESGQPLKLHVFVDGSTADIFVCDRWAFSVRLFPTNSEAIGIEAFAEAETPAQLNAWILDAPVSDPSAIASTTFRPVVSGRCYDLQGRQVSRQLRKGLMVVNGKKILR